MRYDLIDRGYIPLDKSWMIRMGVLDLIRGYDDCIDFLRAQYSGLSDDLKALYHASVQWKKGEPLDVGESATLYRFLRFASWKMGREDEFVTHGTLKDRKISSDHEIVEWPPEKLLTLDNGTSQWASASILMGNSQRVRNPPFKLQLAYDAVDHWEKARYNGKRWDARYDETILGQASAYLKWLSEGRMDFAPEQAEDYCFARAFGLIDDKEGERRWPSLRGHESDRIYEMERALQQKVVDSNDHRVIQSIAILGSHDVDFLHPEAVNKSWPQFWRFFADAKYLKANEPVSEHASPE